MRKAYHQQLDRLGAELAGMCGMVGEAMQRASLALLDADLVMAEKVIADDSKIVKARAGCEGNAYALLALQAPVAADLRVVLTAVHAADSIEQMGDLALHVARSVRRRYPTPVLPDSLRSAFADMGQLAITLANTAEQVIRTRDVQLAGFLEDSDDIMDDLHRAVFAEVTREDWEHGVSAAVDATLLSQCYERFADHAVSLARRTTYIVTGKLAISA